MIENLPEIVFYVIVIFTGFFMSIYGMVRRKTELKGKEITLYEIMVIGGIYITIMGIKISYHYFK